MFANRDELSGSLSKSGSLHFGSEKAFLQTFLSELSLVMSKSKDVKIIF